MKTTKKQIEKYRYILIDGNNLYWRAVSSHLDESKMYTNEVYVKGFHRAIQMVKDIHNKLLESGGEIYFLFDNPLSKINERERLSGGEYKHMRKEMPPEFYDLMKHFIEVMCSFSDQYRYVKVDRYEADDLVEPVLKTLNSNYRTLLISTDLDWTRSMSENCDWLTGQTIYTLKSFADQYGFTPNGNRIKMYKTIHGDVSDNIPNAVPNIKKDLLIYLVKKYTSVSHLTEGCDKDEKINKHWREKIFEAKSRLILNYALVDFLPFKGDINKNIHKCKRNVLDLKVLYDTFGFPHESFMMESKEDFISSFFKTSKIDVR